MAILPADCHALLRCHVCFVLQCCCLHALQDVSMHPFFVGRLKFPTAGVAVLQTMDMTLSQVYEALASRTVATSTLPHSPSDIREIVLPPVKSVVSAKRSMFTGLH